MKIGICSGIERITELESLGFDYIEPMLSALAAQSEADFQKTLKTALSSPLPVRCFNVMFPQSIRLLTGETTQDDITGYLDKAFFRASLLGADKAVFGSGNSRMRPGTLPYDEAWRRLADIAFLIAQAGKKHGITVCIEPLGTKECNMICSLAEGAGMVSRVNKPNFSLLTDWYHMACNGESPDEVARIGMISHVHVAQHEGRRYPGEASRAELRPFVQKLKTIGYQGDISVEGNSTDLQKDAPEAVRVLRELWAED